MLVSKSSSFCLSSSESVRVFNVTFELPLTVVTCTDLSSSKSDTAGTISNAANALRDLGAKNVYACCTHGVLSGPAFERINNSAIEELVMLNTIPLREDIDTTKITSISVAPLFAEAIKRIYDDQPISKLFEYQK